jgi:hypothetical protein
MVGMLPTGGVVMMPFSNARMKASLIVEGRLMLNPVSIVLMEVAG